MSTTTTTTPYGVIVTETEDYMTTTTTVCPPWCVEGGSCYGEHASGIVYLPTSGGFPVVQPGTGTTFPVVAVRASHDTIDGLAPCVDVHMDGGAVDDAQASLLVGEARALAQAILAACDQIEGRQPAG